MQTDRPGRFEVAWISLSEEMLEAIEPRFIRSRWIAQAKARTVIASH
jgi:hypothetical protein